MRHGRARSVAMECLYFVDSSIWSKLIESALSRTFEASCDESHSTPVLQVRLKFREKRDTEGVHSRRVMYLVDDWGRSTNLQICNDIRSEIRKCAIIPTTRSWLTAWLIRLLESVWGELEDGCCWSAMHARQAPQVTENLIRV